MDKKNFIIGITCLFAAFTLFINQEKRLRENLNQTAVTSSNKTEVPTTAPNQTPSRVHYFQPTISAAKILTLENDVIRVNFSDVGGAIQSIELKHYCADQNKETPYLFNKNATIPALMLAWNSKNPITNSFAVTEKTENFIQFSTTLSDGTTIVRGYRLEKSDASNPYIIKNEFSVQQSQLTHDHIFLHLGMMPDTPGDKYLEYLNFSAFDGKKAEFKRIADFEPSNGFLGFGKHDGHPYLQGNDSYIWGALKNQFFVAILTPKTPADGYITFPQKQGKQNTIEGILQFNLNSTHTRITSDYYVGPKDFILLDKMGKSQDQLMQFGFFGAVSKLLLMSMRGIHSFVPNWGWTIIVLTIIIKLLLWPITQAQLRSSKKMASIQEPLKKIREKYKGNPQKLQMETMKLFKENRVNPAAGCLPVFIQIPIFIGLYYMLRTSSEIRFQSFLWIQDLSVPDTVGFIGSFPINILPLIMGITMFVQMKITPTPSMDGMQQKVIMWMPFIFLIFCYSFPAALVLYWTVQNLFTIFQQWLTNRSLKKVQTTTLNQ